MSRLVALVFGQLVGSERGARRIRLAGFAVFANVFAKALGFAVLLYSTRVALVHLGPDRFGVWITITSVATLLSFMDLGLSNALIGRVAGLTGLDSDRRLRWVVTNGLLALLAIGVVAALLLAGVFTLVPWALWFKGSPSDVLEEARLTGYVFALLFGLSLPVQGISKVYAGLQHGWIANIVSAGGWVASAGLIAVAPHLDAPMWYYLFATFGIQQFAGILLLLGLARRHLLERPSAFAGAAKGLRSDALYGQGKEFFTIQVAYAVVWGSNQIILSSMIGAEEAATFGVLQRLFMIVQVALTILNGPLWAAYADALAHREAGFIRELLKRSMLATLAGSSVGVALLVGWSDMIVRLLAQDAVTIPSSAIILMALWTVIEACGIAFAMYLNGTGRVRPQAVTGVVHMLISVPAKAAAVSFFGLHGLLATTIVSYLLFSALPLVTIYRSQWLGPLREASGELRAA